jgi:hypothetical protein
MSLVPPPIVLKWSVGDSRSLQTSMRRNYASGEQTHMALSKVQVMTQKDLARFDSFDDTSLREGHIAPPGKYIGVIEFRFAMTHQDEAMTMCWNRRQGRYRLGKPICQKGRSK